MGEMIILGKIPREGTFVDNWIKYGVGLIDTSNPLLEPDKFPGTIMDSAQPIIGSKYGHITLKPVPLLRYLIRIFSGHSPIILDPFAGCGSIGETCITEGYSFIGYELDSLYTHYARKRMAAISQA